ncbi:MAG: metalloregulator ArsR/SmtB family transcription factor [Gammaproteobacteria bacterium]|nr:metalloregulator ArsR/SmtB family transcription factor [Gammaproteobacteria bacterium]
MSNRSAELVTRLKAAADPVRLRLLSLCRQGECSVSELNAVVGLSQPRMSQQLKVLCDAGLLQRFRDGQRVYYRWPQGSAATSDLKHLLALLPEDEPQFAADATRLRQLRRHDASPDIPGAGETEPHDRALHRAILDLTVTQSVGDLLDVGCGRGQLLKLLSSRANRAVGVDIDSEARDLARADLMLAGLSNCTLRKGDMYSLPFEPANFDTIILDDVLPSADRPVEVLLEAQRVLRPDGKLLLLQRIDSGQGDAMLRDLATWCADARLRMSPARYVSTENPRWLLTEARPVASSSVAA